jgi:hypothetical protein
VGVDGNRSAKGCAGVGGSGSGSGWEAMEVDGDWCVDGSSEGVGVGVGDE